jgi:hypothetical protein
MWTDVSEELIASIFRVENQASTKQACNRRLHLGLLQTKLRYVTEDGNIQAIINFFFVIPFCLQSAIMQKNV